MKDLLAVIAPDTPSWRRFRTSASVLSLEVDRFTDLDAFLACDLSPADTVAVVDADAHGESIAGHASELVRRGQAGVITISDRLEPQERLRLTRLGIDHCLVRPVDDEELLAIAGNLLRRSHGAAAAPRVDRQCWVLDLRQWRLTTPGGQDIDLSAGELNLLRLMFQSPGRARPRRDLRVPFDRPSGAAEDRSIDVMISRLRRKVEEVSAARLPLRSARGEGYVFASPALIIP